MDRSRSHGRSQSSVARIPGNLSRFNLEMLEPRQLMSANFYSIDGTANNLTNPTWGSAGSDLLRQALAAYTDLASTPAGANRPSARAISNAISAVLDGGQLNARNMSAFVYAWGQFLDHDLDLTVGNS